jgi:spore maturation protein CgeB
VAWCNVEDCLALIDRYLGDDAARQSIAKAGQARTFAAHTFRRRVEEILAYLG